MKFEKALAEGLEIGDEILMGKFRNKRAIIKDFGTDKNGQPTVVTNKGERAMYSFRVQKLMNGPSGADKYHEFYKEKLKKYDVPSPKKLSRAEAKKFWSEIKSEWKASKTD
jgi:hypothetical protein